MLARVSSGFIALLMFLMILFLISSGSPPQPFVTSFAYLPGQAIVSSNDQCEPGSLVHCIGRQPQENGLGNNNTGTITTSSESSESAIGQSQHRNGLGTLAG